MSALLLATGFYPRIVITENHVYPQLYLGDKDNAKKLTEDLANRFRDTVWWFRGSDGRYWLSLDWTSRHIGGKPLEDEIWMIIYPDGTYTVYK
jgi:hypothetical protein